MQPILWQNIGRFCVILNDVCGSWVVDLFSAAARQSLDVLPVRIPWNTFYFEKSNGEKRCPS